MKKLVALFVLVLCSTILFTTTAFATTFTVSDTDISIDIDESVWYVFTRDNLDNNPELDELGLSYDHMNESMQKNSIYLDAIMFYSDAESYLELLVSKVEVEEVMQLSSYNDRDVKAFAKALADEIGEAETDVYQTAYKYARLEYVLEGFYVVGYHTIVNGENYNALFKSEYPFVEEDYRVMETIMESVTFNVDPDLVDENTGFSMDWGRLGNAALEGAVIGGAVTGVAALVSRRKGNGKGKREKGGKRLQKPSQKE